jgi:large subunit ribosomal protein L24
MKLKKQDKVVVTAGKDKGRQGKIEKVFPASGRVLIPGMNIAKKHVKPRGEKQPGGIIDVAQPLPMANVALLCPKCQQPTRVGYRLDKDNQKSRICKKCQQLI